MGGAESEARSKRRDRSGSKMTSDLPNDDALAREAAKHMTLLDLSVHQKTRVLLMMTVTPVPFVRFTCPPRPSTLPLENSASIISAAQSQHVRPLFLESSEFLSRRPQCLPFIMCSGASIASVAASAVSLAHFARPTGFDCADRTCKEKGCCFDICIESRSWMETTRPPFIP
jgi:hypothetical protein